MTSHHLSQIQGPLFKTSCLSLCSFNAGDWIASHHALLAFLLHFWLHGPFRLSFCCLRAECLSCARGVRRRWEPAGALEPRS